MDKGTGIRNERSSNIELLRIVAACGVIALHYNDLAISNETNRLVLSMSDVFWAWSVDVFLMISGFCSFRRMEFDWKKPVMLYVQLVFFRLFAVLLSALSHGSAGIGGVLRCFLPINYFFCIYIAVYLVSPLLNRASAAMDRGQRRRALLLLFGIFSLWAYGIDLLSVVLDTDLAQATPLSISGNISGHNVVNFVLCYLIGAAMGSGTLTIRKPLLCFAVSAAAALALAPFFTSYLASSYCSPLVIVQAASALAFFSKLKLGAVKWINRLAAACFTVYLTHITLFAFVQREHFVDSRLRVMLAHLVLCQIGLYLAGFLLHEVYDFVTRPLFRAIWKSEKLTTNQN